MSDFLARLVARSYGDPSPAAAGAVRPRLPSLFEPATAGPPADDVEVIEAAVARAERGPHRGHLAAEALAADGAERGQAVPRPTAGMASRASTPIDSDATTEPPRPRAEPETGLPPRTAQSQDGALARAARDTGPVPEPRTGGPDGGGRAVPFAAARSPVPVSAFLPQSQSRREDEAPPPPVPPPTIHVTIGRVEVRAVLPSTPPKPQPAPPAPPRTLSLADYLNDRKGAAGGQP